MDRDTFAKQLSSSAFAFRGYNVTNLGRSNELLGHAAYGPILTRVLEDASQISSDILGRRIDLVKRVRENIETDLECYDEAISLVLGVERAQLEMLRSLHGIECRDADCFCGYSLGEVSALVEAGSISFADAMRVPLSLASDCVELARNVTLGILIARAEGISREDVARLCAQVNREGKGVVGVSADLSPNSMLLMAQNDRLDRFQEVAKASLERRVQVRRNENRWPPLHTPIVWQRNISDRAAQLMLTLDGGDSAPSPPILSMVTGDEGYTDTNIRAVLRQWTDHRQELWQVVLRLLERNVESIVHVGPAPNIIPATFKRLADNVDSQTRGSVGMRTLSQIVRRPWLQSLLPKRTMLLNVVRVDQVLLEDWLLDNEPE